MRKWIVDSVDAEEGVRDLARAATLATAASSMTASVVFALCDSSWPASGDLIEDTASLSECFDVLEGSFNSVT